MNIARINKIRELQEKGFVRGTHFTIDVWIDPEEYDIEDLDNDRLERLEESIRLSLEAFAASIVSGRKGVDFTL